jgi:hypothetical protein
LANENDIVVSIVLDNGSVVKGFAKLEQGAKDASKKSQDHFSEMEQNFSVDGIVNKIKNIGPAFSIAAGIATAAIAAIGVAFERSLSGEKLQAAEKQFEAIAESAGLIGSELEKSIVKASKGTFDFSDNLESINKTIIELGVNANKLPQIMDVALKATSISGKSVEDTFKAITAAIESGNAKQLKQAGILIDGKKAFDEYGASIGLAGKELNLAQKQQALLNAAISQAGEKFKDVDVNSRPMQTALDRIKVALSEIGDSTAKAFNRNLGAYFADALNGVANALGGNVDKSVILRGEIDKLSASLESAKKLAAQGGDARFDIQFLEEQISSKKAQIKNLEDVKDAADDDARKAGRSTGGKDEVEQLLNRAALAQKSKQLDDEQLASRAQKMSETRQMLLDANQAEIDFQLSKHEKIENLNQRQLLVETDINSQRQLLIEQHEKNVADIKQKYAGSDSFSKAQAAKAIEAEDIKHKTKLAGNSQKLADFDKLISKAKLAQTQSDLGAIAGLMESGSKELFEIGKIAGIANATISTYESINKTLAAGGVFAIPAAIAIGIMGFLNVSKIANTSFGGGASGSSGGSSLSLGGGLNSGITTPIDSPALAEPAAAQKPETKIQVNIAGNVLDNRETSLHIVELLNSAFEQHGAKVVGAV